MDVTEQIKRYHDFIEKQYLDALYETVRKGENKLVISFLRLIEFDPELANDLLERPEECISAAEFAIKEFDLPAEVKNFRVRFNELSESQKMMIRNIRSKHLSKLFHIEGIVRQKSDVRPQVTSAKFECPSCGNIISVLQLEAKFREPSRCGCGRKGKFRVLSKELIDAQRLVLEEAPEDLDGGEQPKRIGVFLKDDLVSPMSDKKTNPGNKVMVTGIVKEVEKTGKDGGKLTQFDLHIEANYIEPSQEDYYQMEVTEEDEEKIKKIAYDPRVYTLISESIAPTIFGYDRVKEAIALQLVGGVKKSRNDGTTTRGDMHVLLIGDPGSGKSQILKRTSKIAPKARYVSGKGVSGAGLCVSPNSFILTNPGGIETIKQVVEDRLTNPHEVVENVWKQENITDVKIQSLSHDLTIHSKYPDAIWKLKAPETMFEIRLSSGKKIELTGNTKLLTITEGRLAWKKCMELTDEYIATPRKLIQGTIEKQYSVDLIKSNPVVHNIKPFVKELTEKLCKKYGTVRIAAKKLNMNENNLYHNWVLDSARGNIKLNTLKKICDDVQADWKEKIGEISLYNGKNHSLPVYLDEDFFYMAGLIAGDGDIRLNNDTVSVRLSNSDGVLHDIFKNILHEQFNLSFDIQKGTSKRPTSTRTNSKILGEILLALGIPFSPKSHKIKLSDVLLHSSNKLLSHYIAGLIDTDGSVVVRKTHGSDNIEYTTCSEMLARQLQLVLLRFGIHSKLRSRSPSTGRIKGNYDKWILVIRGIDQIRLFASQIKLRHPVKKVKLERIIKKNMIPNTNVDIVSGLGKKLREICKKNKIKLKSRLKGNLSRNKLQNILLHIEDCHFTNISELAEIKKITFSDIFWEKIVSIAQKKPSYDYVYDLTVADSHNFVVDGVLVHNTASVVKDEFLGGWSLEAGALPLANKGFCLIDEMDKMSEEDTAAMHEALEGQTITISKANIQATLRAETTVLAAANPKLGRFDPYDILAKQIAMPPALINRFDLIFAFKDLPNTEKDERMASHILKLHQNPDVAEPEITTEILRKFISYARQNCHPVLTSEAIEELKTYYVQMRNSSNSEEAGMKAVPISARQLEALVRLAEATAKLRLGKEVTKEDAKRAVDILHFSLSEIGIDPETGKIDIDRIASGITASQRTKIHKIKDIILELENKFGKNVPIQDIIEEAKLQGLTEDQVEEALEKLKRSGDLFEPTKGYVASI